MISHLSCRKSSKRYVLSMDLSLSDSEHEFRAQARAWLEANVPKGLSSTGSIEDFQRIIEFEQRMFADGWAMAEDIEGAQCDVSAAKARASDMARLVSRTCLHSHGGIGYTVEYDLHMWMKRSWALSVAWGDASSHRRRLAELLDI